jgi:DNA-binding NarL/FixJ family response regulator
MTAPALRSVRRPEEAGRRAAEQPETVRILVADDHVFVRELLTAELGRGGGAYDVVGGVGSLEQALDACRVLRPDILILDHRLPGRADDAVGEFKRRFRRLRILLCSETADDDELLAAITAGVHGFMQKTSSRTELLLALERLSRGEVYFCPRSSGRLRAIVSGEIATVAPADERLLSPREREILGLIAAGQTSKEIAGRLQLSCATIDTHRRNLMRKARARNAAELIRYGQQHGFVRRLSGFGRSQEPDSTARSAGAARK